MQAVPQRVTSVLAVLGINAIPAGIVLLGGNSAATALVLYFLENLVLVILAALRVRILAPANDEAYADMGYDTVQTTVNGVVSTERRILRNRRVLITDYLLVSLAFSIGLGIFIFMFLFVIGNANIPGSVILSGLAGIVAFQLLHFFVDLALLGPLTPTQAGILLQKSMGHVALIYFAVFIGFFLAAANINWFVIPFVALKTISDLALSIQTFTARIQMARSFLNPPGT